MPPYASEGKVRAKLREAILAGFDPAKPVAAPIKRTS